MRYILPALAIHRKWPSELFRNSYITVNEKTICALFLGLILRSLSIPIDEPSYELISYAMDIDMKRYISIIIFINRYK